MYFYFIFPLNAFGQVQNGQITGIIAEPSGAVIAQATVHVRNLATGYEVDIESNESGIYRAQELIVGSYTVRVEMLGFKTVTATNLALNAGTVLRVDFKLTIGSRSSNRKVDGRIQILSLL